MRYFWLFVGLTVLLISGYALAGSVTFANVCANARFAQKGDDLTITCPGATRPWLTFKGCKGARVLKDGAGNHKVICAA